MPTSVRRLYKEIKPSAYLLEITPDATHMCFSGHVTVRLKKTGRPSQRLTFHQRELKVEQAEIIKHDKKGQHAVPVVRINNQDTLDEVRLHTDDMLYAGEYEVRMRFSGQISRSMTGLYPCYFTLDDTEHILLATQFESHHAREVFPCIDEPEAKATFKLSLTAPKSQQVLSNTPIETQVPEEDSAELTRTTFETTPKMSSYLLAFVIGEIHSKRSHTARGTEVAIWGTIAQPVESFEFALDVAKGCIEFFEEYFGVAYPLPKADHIGLPDFSSGAMENWGLITYRERLLFAYPNEAAQSTKEVIAEVIAHETSHQWFGNLVTMRWWDDLWLNESFANVMGYHAPASLFPSWNLWDEYIAGEGLSALRRDATKGVQAIRTVVRHPAEISTLFDPSIVYAKGGRLIYMLMTYIGEAAFRKGLAAYFKKHAYANTTGDDLWESIRQASGVDVQAFMDPWLQRPGFPVLSVDQQGNEVTITQQHFLESGEESDGRIWPVPLFAERSDFPAVLERATLQRRLSSSEALILNRGAIGHYIVHYVQPAHREYVAEQVRKQTMADGERFMLLNNASMLSKAGYQSFDTVLRLLQAYEGEQSEIVWGAMSLILAETRRFVDLDPTIEQYIKKAVRKLIQREHTRLGWTSKPGESTSDQKLRATIIALGGYAEDELIIAEAIKQFTTYQQDTTTVDPELRSIVFGIAIKQSIPKAFKYLLDVHDQTTNSDLQADCMAGLTTTCDPKEAQTLLDRLTNASLIKPQDADHWLAYLLRNRHSRMAAWEWMTTNWEWIEATYADDKSYDSFPRYAASACNTKEWGDKYADFFAPKQEDIVLKRNITIALSEIATRVQWLERDLAGVKQFLETL